jgi:hypothetical protein
MHQTGVPLRVVVRTFADRFAAHERLAGNAEAICRQVVERAWNGAFYQTGLSHFDYFWMRDFGTVVASLVRLGERERAHATLRWALDCYEKADTVTTCIDREGRAFDVPLPSIDALSFLLYAITVLDLPLTVSDRDFLQAEAERFSERYIDPRSGMIRAGATFSELRDAVRYTQSAYAVTMLALLSRAGAALQLELGVIARTDYAALLRERYWSGEYFAADIGNSAFSAECSMFPFFLGVIDDASMRDALLATIARKQLARPYPMRYTDQPRAFRYRWWHYLLMPRYASTTVWTWHGAIYLHLLREARAREFEEARSAFAALIERHGDFPELLNPDGSWYASWCYRAETGMIWAALYLDLIAA